MKVLILLMILYAIYCNGLSQQPAPSSLPSINDCEVTYDYLELLEQGTDDEEMSRKIPCTIIKGRKANWEYQLFQRSKCNTVNFG